MIPREFSLNSITKVELKLELKPNDAERKWYLSRDDACTRKGARKEKTWLNGH